MIVDKAKKFYMKIGGTGFNLSPAHFQKSPGHSDHSTDFHRLS
jgi:hypothetical protein